MFINEQNTQQWAKMLKENFNAPEEKLGWMSEYAAVHTMYESQMGVGGAAMGAGANGFVPAQGVSPLYATPLNTTGMGNPTAPSPLSNTSTSPASFFNQQVGSGDIPMSTLPMSLNVALWTVGLDLLPVVTAKGPWHLVTYADAPYAGGKLGGRNEIASIDGIGKGAENKPLYFKVVLDGAVTAELKPQLAEGKTVEFINGNKIAKGTFKAIGRMDGGIICQIVSAQNNSTDTSLKDVFTGGLTDIKIDSASATINDANKTAKLAAATVDFAQTQVDFIDGFANFASGKKEAMTRGQNETGTGNVIGIRMFSKWIEMGSYEVTGTLTRQQLQDLPLYGVDGKALLMEVMQNEITQSINARILDYSFAMGVTNAVNQRNRQGVDLNLHMGTADTTMAATSIAHYTDVYGVDHKATWGTIKNSEVNTSAENLHTRQRRIATRIIAAANLIAQTGRRGKANWAVVNTTIATALQDCSSYVVAPMENTLSQSNDNLYMVGTLAGIKIYVDPYMDWDDNRVCVGRKGNGREPGLVFLPYILSDQVSIVAEGTMSYKCLLNSRYAIAPLGFYPEANYYTFCVDCPEFGII